MAFFAKFLSRRFLTSLLVVLFGLFGVNASDDTIAQIVSAVLALGGLLGFQISEGLVDKAREQATVYLPVAKYHPSSWSLEYKLDDSPDNEEAEQ